MKLGPVTKLAMRNMAASKKKKNNDDFTSGNCDVIVIFLSFGLFGVISKVDSGHIFFFFFFYNDDIQNIDN